MSDDQAEEFNWDDVQDDLIQQTTSAVAVYFNPKGEVVIRQQAIHYGDEDSFVYLPFNKVRPLIEKLRVMLDEGGPNAQD